MRFSVSFVWENRDVYGYLQRFVNEKIERIF